MQEKFEINHLGQKVVCMHVMGKIFWMSLSETDFGVLTETQHMYWGITVDCFLKTLVSKTLVPFLEEEQWKKMHFIFILNNNNSVQGQQQ